MSSREWTDDEIREKFIDHIRHLIKYWAKVPRESVEGQLSGLAHSILVLIDGGTHLPSFALVPTPHPDDKKYHIDNDENWYPNEPQELKHDISGYLHELLYNNHEIS